MTTPTFLVRLMSYTGLARTARLTAEDEMAIGFANDLRKAVLEGRLRAVFCHPANELAGFVTMKGGKVRVPVQIAIARALGLITGTADYLFLWNGGCCALEAKSETGGLRLAQRDFRDWCKLNGVPYHVFRSAEEGLSILRGYGVLEG